MFGKLFGKKKENPSEFIVVNLNAKLLPMHRGEFFEDPIDQKIQELSLGTVTGGGTLQSESGEIENCDIEIQVQSVEPEAIESIKKIFESFGAPKGSKITIDSSGSIIEFGITEGLALYLNGTDLPPEVYKNSDINYVISEIASLLAGKGTMLSHWQGNTETALYFYGHSFVEMKGLISAFLDSYPLCQKARVVQIA